MYGRLQSSCFCLPAIVLLFTLVLNSCSKVPEQPVNPPPTPPRTDTTGVRDSTSYYHIDLKTKVISSVSGFVESGNVGPQIPEGALVTYGNKTTLTDKYGYFDIRSASVIKEAAQLTISKKEFITSYRTFIAEDGQSFFIKINLDHQPGGVMNTGSGTHENGDGVSVSFQGGFVNEMTNSPYSGFARPYLSRVDRGDEDMSEKMPGSARGLDSLGYPKFLRSFGVVTFAVHGMDGENLELGAGGALQFSFMIYGEAPVMLDAWHYDTKIGLWRKEGAAVKSGYGYTFRTTKLGSWNFALASDGARFKARILTEAGEPIPFTYVTARLLSPPADNVKPVWLYTDLNGFVSGITPASSSFSLDIHGDQCNTPIFSKAFNNVDSIVDAGDIKIASRNLVSVNATVTNCNGLGIANGFVMVRSPHHYYRLNAGSNGHIRYNTVVCDFAQLQTLMFVAEDEGALQISDNLYAKLVPGHNDLGNLSTCGRNGTVKFSGRVLDQAGVGLEEMYVEIAPNGDTSRAFRFESKADGSIQGTIYNNTNFTLSVYGAKDCNTPLITRNFTTVNQDISLGNFTITGITTATITGSVVDCDNNIVTDGFVALQRDTKTYIYEVNQAGIFNFTIRLCNAASAETITMIAQDEAKLQTGNLVAYTVSAGNNNVGSMKACFDSLSNLQFISYSVDNTPTDILVAPANTLTQFLDPTGNFMYIRGSNDAYGRSAGLNMYANKIAPGSTQSLEEFYSPQFHFSIIPPIPVKITEYGAVGKYISGHFTGMVQQSPDNPIPRKIICSFRVKRNE